MAATAYELADELDDDDELLLDADEREDGDDGGSLDIPVWIFELD